MDSNDKYLVAASTDKKSEKSSLSLYDLETKAEKTISSEKMAKDINIVKFIPGTLKAIVTNGDQIQAWNFDDQSKIYESKAITGITAIEFMPQMSDYCVVGSSKKSWSVFNVLEGTQIC